MFAFQKLLSAFYSCPTLPPLLSPHPRTRHTDLSEWELAEMLDGGRNVYVCMYVCMFGQFYCFRFHPFRGVSLSIVCPYWASVDEASNSPLHPLPPPLRTLPSSTLPPIPPRGHCLGGKFGWKKKKGWFVCRLARVILVRFVYIFFLVGGWGGLSLVFECHSICWYFDLTVCIFLFCLFIFSHLDVRISVLAFLSHTHLLSFFFLIYLSLNCLRIFTSVTPQ